ncbi:protein phosphatase 2C domain-containing protein, partial [Streptomyces sp. NPDC054956]
MSQQGAGADDWWQKLYYEDPDPGPDPDPRDTLDHRFRSAAVLVAPPAVPGPRRGAGGPVQGPAAGASGGPAALSQGPAAGPAQGPA